MRYPQCTSPISNALYIGILALSSEVSEDTTDYTLEKILLVLVPCSINDNYQSEGFGLAVRNYRARSPSRDDQGDRSLISYFERGRESGVRATSVFSCAINPLKILPYFTTIRDK